MPGDGPTSVIPEGYTFLSYDRFVSKKAFEILEDYLQSSANRNPDAHDVYIYNDYYSYAILDLVDELMKSFHSRVVQKKYDQAMMYLEVLSIFQNRTSMWPMIDDGERTTLTNRAFGACVVTLLRKLDKEGRLDSDHFPNLETILRETANWGKAMESIHAESQYHLVCKGFGERLFANKSVQDKALETARLEEWIASLDQEDQEDVREAMKEEEQEKADIEREFGEEEPWYEGGDEDDPGDYVVSRTWSEYKEYLAECPNRPAMGPPVWDITEWPQWAKDKYSFGNMSEL